MEKLYRNRSWMTEHYVERDESMSVMARKADYNLVTIYRWLHKLGIPVRTISEGTFLAKRNFLTLSPELLDLLEGELLGDGCVSMNGNRSACYHHSSKYEEYLVWLSAQFANLGLEQAGKIYSCVAKWGTVFHYASKSYPELASIRQRWYPEGKKIIPRDLELTPLRVRQWFLGDSHLAHPSGRRPHIEFTTNGFDVDSVEYLVEELRGQGFKATRRPANNTIGLSVYSVKDFLSWIGPCPISCYQYKWELC